MKKVKSSEITLTDGFEQEYDTIISERGYRAGFNMKFESNTTFTSEDIKVNSINFNIGVGGNCISETGSLSFDRDEYDVEITFKYPANLKVLEGMANCLNTAVKNLQKSHKKAVKLL